MFVCEAIISWGWHAWKMGLPGRLRFTGLLLHEGVTISMDGRGRAFDNIFIERLWRSVKCEEVYLHDYEDAPVCIAGLRGYFRFYNEHRLHQALGYKTPQEVYFGHND
jgi:putative transposase